MRTSSQYRLLALGAALAAPALAIACSDEPASLSVGDADAGGTTPDAAAPEASAPDVDAESPLADAGSDADAAPLRTCTDEGWCHSTLPETNLTLRDVWGDGQGVVWSVSESGKVLRWDGTAWAVVFTAPGALYSVWGSSPTDLWIGGANGLLHGTGSASNALTFQAVDLEVPIHSILGFSGSDIWATGYAPDLNWTYDTGRLFHYAGGTGASAAEWIADDISSTDPGLYSKLWGTSGNDVWLGGEGMWGSPLVRHRLADGTGGFAWSANTTAPEVPYGGFRTGFSISKDVVWLTAFGAPGTYFVGNSIDDGATFTWTEGAGAPVKAGMAHIAGWGTAPNDVWLAGIYGRLNHWDGTTWRPASIALTDVFPVVQDFYAMWGKDPNNLWVVGQDIALHKRAPQ